VTPTPFWFLGEDDDSHHDAHVCVGWWGMCVTTTCAGAEAVAFNHSRKNIKKGEKRKETTAG
jgi:hypothetical protein